MANSTLTRSKANIWLIGHPTQIITGARLPSGRDVMKNFAHHHRICKLTIAESSKRVYDLLLPFWLKSRLPIRDKSHIIKKLKQLYNEQTDLIKHRSRSNSKDVVNQQQYSEKLDKLFDISHANSAELIKNDEDRLFLQLQQRSRTGCIGPVDVKLAKREARTAQRQQRFLKHARLNSPKPHDEQGSSTLQDNDSTVASQSESTSSSDEQDDFVVNKKKCI